MLGRWSKQERSKTMTIHIRRMFASLATVLLLIGCAATGSAGEQQAALPPSYLDCVSAEEIAGVPSGHEIAGTRVGAWGGVLEHTLVVDEIDDSSAVRVWYAHGAYAPWGLGPDCFFTNGLLLADGRLRVTLSDGATATYTPDGEGGLEATFRRGDQVTEGYLKPF